MTAGQTAVFLPRKPSSADDSGFKHCFGAEASLPIIQSIPELLHDTTRLFGTLSLCGNAISMLMNLVPYSESLFHIHIFPYGNLLSFLLRCGTRPYERGTQ